MSYVLQSVIDKVLLHHLDDNLVSEEARKRIAQDICAIYLTDKNYNENILLPASLEEISEKAVIDFYKNRES
ncbi:MAG: hypothetical protein JETCAE03_32670 [Ignavibacteriaceae bacterium]|nr:MAG: hypothetical protein JETCAE03_32670 [Ignavibacteriaceae bacterium]